MVTADDLIEWYKKAIVRNPYAVEEYRKTIEIIEEWKAYKDTMLSPEDIELVKELYDGLLEDYNALKKKYKVLEGLIADEKWKETYSKASQSNCKRKAKSRKLACVKGVSR